MSISAALANLESELAAVDARRTRLVDAIAALRALDHGVPAPPASTPAAVEDTAGARPWPDDQPAVYPRMTPTTSWWLDAPREGFTVAGDQATQETRHRKAAAGIGLGLIAE